MGVDQDKQCKKKMRNLFFPGSTLVETLVMMLVVGIIFLSVMDGLTLFTHLQIRRVKELVAASNCSEGYHRLALLIKNADSIVSAVKIGQLELFSHGERSMLIHADSILVYYRGEFCDTLFNRVELLQLVENDMSPDSVKIRFSTGFCMRFPVQSSAKLYQAAMEKLEVDYVYKE